MGISVFSNTAADRAVLNLNRVSADMARVTERLSSGLRIRGENLSAYILADQFEVQIRSLRAADTNIQSALAALDIADAALATIQDQLLPSLIDMAMEAADGLTTPARRADLDVAFQATKDAINDLIDNTTFAGQKLLDGSLTPAVEVQVMPSTTATFAIDFTQNFRTNAAAGPLSPIGDSGAGLSVANQLDAQNALDALTGDPGDVDAEFTGARAYLGSHVTALEAFASYGASMRVEYADGQTRLVGADFAADTARLVRDQLLLDSGAAALEASSFAASRIVQLLSSAAGGGR